jgi:hypothetical protein
MKTHKYCYKYLGNNHSNIHQKEHDRQCSYNVTSRRVSPTIVAVEKQLILHILSVCVCSLRYPACNAHAPYCHLLHVRLHYIFFTFIHKRNGLR